ncbi:hypothetical protein B3286c1_1780 [Brucella vulpis]|nr:hypothetical protein BF3285c1_1781 [Brucella vulpis]CUW50581.1 hypothetical protein B3286c1_1780 [Brucella vulpis]
MLALEPTCNDSFTASKVYELGAHLKLLDEFSLGIPLPIINSFTLEQRDLIVKLSRSCFCHGHTFGRRNGQISAS